MANKNIDIKIGSRFLSEGFAKAKNAVLTLGRNLMNIQAGITLVRGAWGKLGDFMKSAFSFETQTTQFKTLIGNIDEARAHMADLKALGDTPPFSLDEFARASRSLMVMTDGALGYKKSLELVGDAAAATGQPIEQVGHAVGRLYAIVRDGQPISRAALELRNMGILTPAVVAELQELQKSGASSAEIWEKVEGALGRYSGAMKETEETGEGLMGAIQSRWDNIVRAFSQALSGPVKDGLGAVLDGMKDLEESGSLAAWAEKARQALGIVVDKAREVVDAVSVIGSAIGAIYEKAGISDLWHGAVSIAKGFGSGAGAAIGTWQGGGSFLEGLSAYGKEYDRASEEEIAKGYYGRKLMAAGIFGDEGKEIVERMAQEEQDAADKVEKARAEAAKAAAEAEVTAARDAAEQKRKIAQLEAADEKRRAEALAKEEENSLKEIEKLQKEHHAEQAKRDRAWLQDRIRAVQEANAKEVAELDKKIAAERQKAAEWERDAEKARAAALAGGGGFNNWEREARGGGKEERRQRRMQEAAERRARDTIRDLERRERQQRGGLNADQQRRLDAARRFIEMQDPNKNPAAKRAEELEKQRLAAINKTTKAVDDLRKVIEQRTVL